MILRPFEPVGASSGTEVSVLVVLGALHGQWFGTATASGSTETADKQKAVLMEQRTISVTLVSTLFPFGVLITLYSISGFITANLTACSYLDKPARKMRGFQGVMFPESFWFHIFLLQMNTHI